LVKISLQAAMIMAAIFAAVCLAFAITGFVSLGDIADPTQASDARGFAWYWTFLASVAIGLGSLAWWIARTEGKDDDEQP
jgi:hypothetical protein